MLKEQQIKALAELDRWTKCVCGDKDCGAWFAPGASENEPSLGCPSYLTSYDAIIPLIQKQSDDDKRMLVYALHKPHAHKKTDFALIDVEAMYASPSQLCEALLCATGKWIE